MKQTLFMIVITGFGTMGVLFHPFYGVAVYTLYAVLRPQFMWDWALPPGVAWSRYVAIATILGGIGMALSLLPTTRDEEEPKHSGLSASHYLIAIFAVWIAISYVTAYDRDVAEFYFDEYMKIFTMLIVSTIIVRKIDQLWTLYLIATCALAYIAYEVNIKYLTEGRLDIWLNGYGGVDNNGAGLMLAVGVPLSFFAWEGTKRWYRWIYLAFVPPITSRGDDDVFPRSDAGGPGRGSADGHSRPTLATIPAGVHRARGDGPLYGGSGNPEPVLQHRFVPAGFQRELSLGQLAGGD